MSPNRINIFIAISSIALIAVLIIQVNWIYETAQIKEDIFTEKTNIVLARTTEALYADPTLCQKLETFAGKNELHKIDSLIFHFMRFYNFRVDYTFELVKRNPFKPINETHLKNNIFPSKEPACYTKSLEEANKYNWNLKLNFPNKTQYIKEEMGTMFIASVILIFIVLILFWRTVLLLMKEKKISEHTTDFLNNMTHEFKTPLTNIALAGKMMVKDINIKQGDKIKHYSGIILEENEKLRLQVEQVLSMTALERGEIPLQKTELDIHQLIHYAVKGISVQIENRQGDLKLYLTAHAVVVFGDKNHLTNALCNLIDNAIKYSREKPQLSIRTSNTQEALIVAISDNGIGIKQEHHKEVFDKFFRVPTGDIHDVKGFGLGLAYVKKIVEMHGGTIELQSDEGKGTTFIITLPVRNV